MKIIILLILMTAMGSVPLYSLYYDFTLEDLPMMVLATDVSNNSFYSFYNLANAGVKIYAEDQAYLKFRLKDAYFDLYHTNSLYVDRLSLTYSSADVSLLAGRDYYFEGDGILIGNLADGFKASLNFLGMSERFYLYYSGFLPVEINQFDMTASDLLLTNGPNRLFGGLILEKDGLGVESIGATVLYSQDMSSNNSYDPLYVGLNAKTSITANLVSSCNILGEFGNLSPTNSIQAFGGDIGFYYLAGSDVKYGFILKFSAATGNNNTNTNSGQTYGQFNTFGQYDTGVVLTPMFANLVMAQAGAVLKAFKDHMTINANYYFLSRMTTNDSVNGFYDGSGYSIGDEISGRILYDIDPDFTIFIMGGYFIKGNAFSNEIPKYVLIGGVSIRI